MPATLSGIVPFAASAAADAVALALEMSPPKKLVTYTPIWPSRSSAMTEIICNAKKTSANLSAAWSEKGDSKCSSGVSASGLGV